MCRWLAVQAGQLAANDAKDERTDAKLEEQEATIEAQAGTITTMESKMQQQVACASCRFFGV
jgi:hypothetical protein